MPTYTLHNRTQGRVTLPAPVGGVLRPNSSITFDAPSSLMEHIDNLTRRNRFTEMVQKGMLSISVTSDPTLVQVENLSSQVVSGPSSILTTTYTIVSLEHLWIDGILQYPPSGFLTVSGPSTISASSPIPAGKTIIVEYVKVGGLS